MFLIIKITVSTKFLKLYAKSENRSFFLVTLMKILHPIRITSHSKTLIDNIFSNFISHEIVSGSITATISDHLPKCSFVPNILLNPSTQKSNFHEIDWSKIKQENFILDNFDKLINKM